MAIKIYKKNTAGRRNMSVVKPEFLTDQKPEKSLTSGIKRNFGRSLGKISVRHKGGGHKKAHRLVDFKMDKYNVPGKIISIEKDPFRSALIALGSYKEGEKSNIIRSEGMKTGREIIAAENAPIKRGNRLKIKNNPSGI